MITATCNLSVVGATKSRHRERREDEGIYFRQFTGRNSFINKYGTIFCIGSIMDNCCPIRLAYISNSM